jgi:AraC-like DNA-binding protein
MGEAMVAGFVRMLGHFNVDTARLRICFDYPAPVYSAEYVAVFGNVVHFEEPFVGIELPRVLLDTQARYYDRGVHSVLRALAEDRQQSLDRSVTYAERTRAILIREHGPNRTDMNAVARALTLSARSLRRRLADEGETYESIASQAFSAVAKNLLGRPGWSIQETAHQMGYAEPSAFHRAFRRWTGQTPSAFQRSMGTDRAP